MNTPPTAGNHKRDASKVILESVCSGLTTNVSSVVSLTSQLLHPPQQSPEQTISELASQALISCCDMEEDVENEESEDVPLTATQLGRAALASSLPPDAALFVFADLKNAARALAIDTELHMMYLVCALSGLNPFQVTPINCSAWQGCDWDHLLTIFNKLDSNQKRISKMVGTNEGFIIGRIRGKYSRPDDRQLQLHLRFFSALALFDVINEIPLTKVAEKFKICRGSLQALQQQSATYAAMIVAFCNRLGWQYLRSLLEGFASRLAFGIQAELTELIRVEGIDGSRARVFHDHGITSLAQLAQSTIAEVSTVLSLAVPFESEARDGNQQEWLFGEERMTLLEAAGLVLLRAGDAVREIMRNLGIEVAFPISQKKMTQQVHPAVLRCINESTEKRRSLNLSWAPTGSQTASGMIRLPLLDFVNNEEVATSSPNNRYTASTPVGQKRPPRISFSCSQIAEDSALDIFSSSIMEMSLNDNEVGGVPDEGAEPMDHQPNEIDDLETSLLKVAHEATQCADSFERTVELVNRGTTQMAAPLEDSFDLVSQLIIPKTQLPKKTNRLSTVSVASMTADGSSADLSADLFESFEKSPVVSMKRTRRSIESWSPTVSSPVCKTSRRAKSFIRSFWIDDVCETESTWNAFVTKSTDWEEVSMALIIEGSQINAICLCNSEQMPVFIPICNDNFSGTATEEVSYPSFTLCQNIHVNRRVEHVRRILGACTVYCYSAFKQVSHLRNTLNIEIPNFVCLEYLSFLAHYRTGDSPLSIAQLASRFDWQFNVQQLLKMSPRIKSSTQSFICSRIHERLRSTAVELSSKEAVSLELSATQAVAHITSVGFPFSRASSISMLGNIRSKISSLENECHQHAGKFFNLESPPSVSEVLFVRLKILHPGGSVSGKRHLSASKTILNQISHLHPIVPKIIAFRQLKHAISQCLLPLLEHVSSDDVIRCSFEMSTATGRILSFDPCVQNVGKGELFDGLSTRSLFAAKPDRVLIAADYCQLELRVLAHLSADSALLKQLSYSDRDFFSELSTKWNFGRDAVKQLCYGLIYGMGVKALADSTKMTAVEAQKLLDSFFTSFPRVKTYIANTKEQAEKVGFVETFLRRRRVACTKGRQEERSRDHRQSVNFTIQGTASEIFKKAMTQIHERLKNLDANIVMIVHDEIIVDSKSTIAASVAEILRQEMENVFPNLRVPLKMDPFRIRNFQCDYSLLPQTEYTFKDGTEGKKEVPVIHMFGPLDTGEKACVHIHGALPYFVIRVGGGLTERVQHLMCEKMNKLLHMEIRRKKGPGESNDDSRIPRYVHHLEGFQAKSIYGFHSQMETFAKVYFTSPFHVAKLCGVLGQLATENPIMQPFEAHVPFILQFFIDHSIFGMDWVTFRSVKFRVDPKRRSLRRLPISFLRSKNLISSIPPATTCLLEADVHVSDIMNPELHSLNCHSSNPGLEYIWKEEAERCRLQNRSLEDAFNEYTPRPYPEIRTEKEFLGKLKKAVKLFEEAPAETSSANINETESTFNSTIVEGKNAEVIWGEAIKVDETARPWSETRDFIEFGLEEELLTPDREDEVEEDNVLEMTMLVRDAGEQQLTETEVQEPDRRTPNVLETTILEPARDLVTPSLPDNQDKSQWYRPKNLLPLKRRREMKTSELSKKPKPVQIVRLKREARMRKKVQQGTESQISPKEPDLSLPEEEVVETDGTIEEIEDVCAISLELFICTLDKMPNPATDTVVAASFCVMSNACSDTHPYSHNVISMIGEETMHNRETIQVANEADLFETILKYVKHHDPDILIGYDTTRLSWGYLVRRAEFIGITNFRQGLGRYINPRNTWQRQDHITIDGRLLESVWRVVRRDLSIRSYDRATACKQLLDEVIPVLNDASLTKIYQETDVTPGRPIHYHLRRITNANIAILHKMDWFVRNAEMARVYGIQFQEVWSRGSQLRVESMLLRLAHKLNYVAPSVTIEQRDKMCAPEQLQLILEPESKVYHDPVIVLDFQSLYPSMVIAYNYCFSTLFGKIGNLIAAAEVGSSYIDTGALKYAVDKNSLIEASKEKKIHSSPLNTAFARSEYRQGVVATMLREVLGARIMIKTAMKNTQSKRLLKILDARQLALKLVANVTYGYTAANWSGRMPCVEVADAILSKGRETLERAIRMVNEGEYGGARVIYGDTDSMFVLAKGASLAEAFTIGKKIARDVTAVNPAPVVLKLEKVYTGCVLETKKRYAGWMYESEDAIPKLDAKGIETVRRDTCPIVSDILERSLEYILQKKFNKFLNFLDRRLTAMKETHFSEFIFCKEYRGDYDENAPVPQKKVAEYNQSVSPGYHPLPGERLPYIVSAGEPDSTVISCVRTVDEFLEDEDLKVNVAYYLKAHILAALHRVTDLIPLNIDYLDETNLDCYNLDCNSAGGSPWCRKCSQLKKTYRQALLQSDREARLLHLMRQACEDCQKSNNVDIEDCTNFHCAVNKCITGIARSNTRMAVKYHQINLKKKKKPKKRTPIEAHADLGEAPKTVAGPAPKKNTPTEAVKPVPIVTMPTRTSTTIFTLPFRVQPKQEIEEEQEPSEDEPPVVDEELEEEEEEEYHERTIFQPEYEENTRW